MSQSKCMMVFRWLASWGIRYKFFVRPISSYVSPSPHQHPPIFFIFFKKVDSSEDWTYSMDRAPRVPAANPRTWWCVGLLHISGNLTVSYAGQEGGGGCWESSDFRFCVKKKTAEQAVTATAETSCQLQQNRLSIFMNFQSFFFVHEIESKVTVAPRR